MEKQKNCEHKNKEYIPAEIENYVVENLVCFSHAQGLSGSLANDSPGVDLFIPALKYSVFICGILIIYLLWPCTRHTGESKLTVLRAS